MDECGDRAEDRARLRDHHRREGDAGARHQRGTLVVGEDGRRTPVADVRGEGGAVHAGTGEGGVEVTGPDRPRVQGDAGDADDGDLRKLGRRHTRARSHLAEAGRAWGSGS